MAKLPTDWTSDTVFVEIDARDTTVATHLTKLGFAKYLGVSRNASVRGTLESRLSRCARFIHNH